MKGSFGTLPLLFTTQLRPGRPGVVQHSAEETYHFATQQPRPWFSTYKCWIHPIILPNQENLQKQQIIQRQPYWNWKRHIKFYIFCVCVCLILSFNNILIYFKKMQQLHNTLQPRWPHLCHHWGPLPNLGADCVFHVQRSRSKVFQAPKHSLRWLFGNPKWCPKAIFTSSQHVPNFDTNFAGICLRCTLRRIQSFSLKFGCADYFEDIGIWYESCHACHPEISEYIQI